MSALLLCVCGVAVQAALHPGIELSLTAEFSARPEGKAPVPIVEKAGEWTLDFRPREGVGSFAWSVRGGTAALVPIKIVPGKPYKVRANWNGALLKLDVDGEKGVQIRRVDAVATTNEVVAATDKVKVANLEIGTMSGPIVHIFDLRAKELMPRRGAPITLSANLANLGAQISDCRVRARALTPGVTVEPTDFEIAEWKGTLPREWRVDAGTNDMFDVELTVSSKSNVLVSARKNLVVMPPIDPDYSAAKWTPPIVPTRTTYIDSAAGNDGADGTSPATAWKSFSRVTGRTLGPGEQVLLKRGSVFTEELVISGIGTSANWCELGAYGEGARPLIRRGRMFDRRCLFVTNSSYLVVRDLAVADAGRGLVLSNDEGLEGHILVERCLAHHIEGTYRPNAHGIPEWFNLEAPEGGGIGRYGAIGSAGVRHLVVRDCETYQNSWGFAFSGDDIYVSRFYTHDNTSLNTAPHPMFHSTRRTWFVDSVLDSSGFFANAGTMGIMLVKNRGLVIRGCHFLNLPDTGSHDEGGIDFEAGGEGILVDGCTFRNNAGAAIEVLGLESEQARNIRITNSRFDRNNFAMKLGPSEVFVFGANDRAVDCSCGLIDRNGYVLNPGVEFYANKSEVSRSAWKLADNRAFASSDELNRAMPLGDPPAIRMGEEIWTSSRSVVLAAEAVSSRPLAFEWETREGPGLVRYASVNSASTRAEFPGEGDWRVALKADDGKLWRSARTAVHVLPEKSYTMKAWTFSRNRDTEGWTHWDLGTKKEYFKGRVSWWNTSACAVHYVAGDHYIIALKDSKKGRILSPDDLLCSPTAVKCVRIRMQNHTNSRRMRLSWQSMDEVQDYWPKHQQVEFDVIPNDEEDRVYEVALPFRYQLRRLALSFSADNTPVTGTVRIDYIWLGRTGK